jgi:hypothetical protein
MIIGPVPSYDSSDSNRNACKIKQVEVRHTGKELNGQINIIVQILLNVVYRDGVGGI